MKLIYAGASPFARKVRVLALESGLAAGIEMLDTAVLPIKENAEVNRANPLGKIPVLITAEGEALFDSRVICEYLDALQSGDAFFPHGAERWTCLTRAALADGLMDAALLVRYEGAIRPEALQWQDWKDGQLGKIHRALDALEAIAGELQGPVDIAQIAVGCALGYLDFRLSHLGWRQGHPGLERFFAAFSERESMKATVPA